MNGQTGQYPDYYHPGTKPYLPPGLGPGAPNGHWQPEQAQPQNGHHKAMPYPGQQPPQQTPGAHPGAYANGLPPGHPGAQQRPPGPPPHGYGPPPRGPTPPGSMGPETVTRMQLGAPQPNGLYPPQRYPQMNGGYYDPRKVPGLYPSPQQQPQQQQQQPSPQQQSQPQRHYLDPQKPYPQGPPPMQDPSLRPRFMPPAGFGGPPPSQPRPPHHPQQQPLPPQSIHDQIRASQPHLSYQHSPMAPGKKPPPQQQPETLNDLLRKPAVNNDNNRHLRQVLTSNISSPSPPSHLPPGHMPPGPPPGVVFGAPPPPGASLPAPPVSPAPKPQTPARKTKTPKAPKGTSKGTVTPSPMPTSVQHNLPPQLPPHLAPHPVGLPGPHLPGPRPILGVPSHLSQALSLPVAPPKPKLNTVETTKPKLMPPKMLKISGDINMRKVILSLKSGLLAESKWAIDCLMVLSNSQRSIRIQASLMLALLEHFKCNLCAIFPDLLGDDQSLEELTNAALEECTNYYEGEESLFTFVDDDKEDVIKVKSEPKAEEINGDSCDKELKADADELVDCNTGLPIIFKDDENIPRIPRPKNGLSAGNGLEDSLCDRRKARDIDTLDYSHITLNFDLENDHDDDAGGEDLRPTTTKKLRILDNTDNDQESFDKGFVIRDRQTSITSGRFEAEMANAEKLAVLCSRKDKLDRLLTRCINISNILYNISFCKDNISSLLSYPSLFTILSRLLVYKHRHKQDLTFGQVEEANDKRKCKGDLDGKENIEELFADFPHEMLTILRQNAFGILSNLSEEMNLCDFNDKTVFGILDSVLHWCICRSAIARDPQKPDNLSFQLCALEIVVKLSMKESNIDLILATPPYSRIEAFYGILVDSLGRDEDPTIRELSLVILSNLAQADYVGSRIILHHKYSISNIILFIEQYEMTKHPAWMATPNAMNSHYMVRRACQFLLTLANASIKEEIRFIKRHEEKIRNLALSQLLDEDISKIMADLMFRISK